MKHYIDKDALVAEILPLESADMDYIPVINIDGEYSINVNIWNNDHVIDEGWIPCWSLAALLSVLELPTLEKDNIGEGKTGWMVSVYPASCRYDSDWYDNPIDACYEIILKLNELNLLRLWN